ncbi:hypothetical protein H0H92_015282, partial [Tricholoma furcatifolium]
HFVHEVEHFELSQGSQRRPGLSGATDIAIGCFADEVGIVDRGPMEFWERRESWGIRVIVEWTDDHDGDMWETNMGQREHRVMLFAGRHGAQLSEGSGMVWESKAAKVGALVETAQDAMRIASLVFSADAGDRPASLVHSSSSRRGGDDLALDVEPEPLVSYCGASGLVDARGRQGGYRVMRHSDDDWNTASLRGFIEGLTVAVTVNAATDVGPEEDISQIVREQLTVRTCDRLDVACGIQLEGK